MSTLAIAAHDLDPCPLPESATLTLSALGPFRAGPFDVETLRSGTSTQTLAFSPDTRGIEAVATDGDARFLGYSERRTATGIDVLLLPERRACRVERADSGSYPGSAAGHALGYAPSSGVALIAGEDVDPEAASQSAAQTALALDVHTGKATVLPPERSLAVPRAFATLTAFGAGLLLAGGEDPTRPDGDDRLLDSAELFDPVARAFGGPLVQLVWPRTRHAALALAGGATLLVGGRTEGGLVQQLEAVYADSTRSSIAGLSALATARLAPSVLALDDGRIFVGGGEFPNGDPVGQVEWFSGDGSVALNRVTLPPRPRRAFASLPGGGVLTVAGCSTEDDDTCDCPTHDACPGWDAWWLGADDRAVKVQPAVGCTVPERPLLVIGSDGAPWLLGAGGASGCAAQRFNPWPGDYEACAAAAACIEGASVADPRAQPRFEPEPGVSLPMAPDARLEPLSLGPDALLATTGIPGELVAFRAGTRGTLSRDPLPLVELAASFERFRPDRLRPLRLAPDRALEVTALSPRHYDGALRLGAGDPTRFWITEARYEDVTLVLALETTQAAEPLAPPLVWFGVTPLGGPECPWSGVGDDGARRAEVVRRGRNVTATFGRRRATCSIPAGPLAVGFSAGETTASVKSIHVLRD